MATYGYTPYGTGTTNNNNSGGYTASGYYSWDNRFQGYGGYQQYSWSDAFYSPYRNANNYQNYLDELEAYRKAKKQAERQKTFGINSLADVLLNTDGKQEKYGKINNPLDWVVSTGRAAWDYYKDSYVKPLFNGDFGRVFVNALSGIGEDLDILANPIKGMIDEAGSGDASFLAGIVGAVAGGVAVFASGGAALVPILAGAGAGAGIGAAAGAIITNPEKALTGVGRAFGTTGEGRYNYTLDTGHWLTDIATEIVIDPFNWVTFGSKAVAGSLSKEMTEAMVKVTGKNVSKSVAKQELKAVANTFSDYMYLGTKSLRNVEEVWSKVAWKANPLAVPLKAGKMLWESEWTSTLVSSIKKARYGIYDDVADGVMSNVDVSSKVAAYQELFEDGFNPESFKYKWTNQGRPDIFASFPNDTTPVNKFIGSQFEYYIKQFPNKTGEELQNLVYKDMLKIMRSGTVPNSAVAHLAKESLSGFKFPVDEVGVQAVDEVARKMVMSEYVRYELVKDLTKDAAQTASLIRKHVGASASKYEVIKKSEEMLKTVMGMPDSSIYDIIKTMSADDTIKAFYDPKISAIEQLFERYGVSIDDLKGYMLNDKDVIKTLKGTKTWFSGTGAVDLLDIDKKNLMPKHMLEGVDLLKEMAEDSIRKLDGAKLVDNKMKALDAQDTRLLHIFEDPTVSHGSRRAFTNILSERKSIANATADRIMDTFSTGTGFEYMEKAIQQTDNFKLISQQLAPFDSGVVQRASKLTSSAKKVFNDIKKANDIVKSFNEVANELGSKQSIIKYTQLESGVKALETQIKDMARLDYKQIDMFVLEKVSKIKEQLKQMPDILSNYTDFVSQLRVFRNENAELMGKLIDAGDVKHISMLNKTAELLTPEVNNLRILAVEGLAKSAEGGAFVMQSNNRTVHLLLLSETLDEHGPFVKELASDTSGMGRVLENYSLLEAPDDATRTFIESARHIRQTSKATQNFAEFVHATTNFASASGSDKRVFNAVLDVIEEYNTKGMRAGQVLADLEQGLLWSNLRQKLSYMGLEVDDMTPLRNLISDYVNKQADIGMNVPIIRLFDGESAKQAELFTNSIIKPMFEGIRDINYNQLVSGLEGLSGTTGRLLTGVEQTNRALSDRIVEGRKISRNASFDAVKTIEDEYFKKYPFMADSTSYDKMYKEAKRNKKLRAQMDAAYYELIGKGPEAPGLLQRQKDLTENILSKNRINPATFNMEDSVFGIKSFDRTRDGQVLEKARFFDEAGNPYFLESSPTISSMRDVVYAKVKAGNGNLMVSDIERFLSPDDISSGRAVIDVLDSYHIHNFSSVEDIVYGTSRFKKELDLLGKIQSDYKMGVASLSDYVDAIEGFGDTIFTRSEGFDYMQQNLAGTINSMKVEDFVSVLKHNTNGSGVIMLQSDLFPAGIRKDLVEGLAEYGVKIDEVGDMLVVHKVLDTKAYEGVTPTTSRYGKTVTDVAEAGQLKEMQKLMDSASKLARNKLPFDASVYMPSHLGGAGIAQWATDNVGIGDIIDLDAYIRSIETAKEPILSFVARQDTMKALAGENMIAGTPVKNLFNNVSSTMLRAEDKMKFLDIHFDKRFRLDNLFSHMDDQTIIDMAKTNKQLRFAYLDASGKVHNIRIKNQQSLKFAREAKAVVTTTGNYNQMYKHINQFKLENLPGGKVLDGFRRIVQTPFTAMYFSNPGTVLRNQYDATIKNMIITGDPGVVGDAFNAYRMINDVNDMVKQIMLKSDNQFTEAAINAFFDDIADVGTRKLMRNKFDLVQEYMNSGASSGPLQAITEGMEKSMLKKYGELPYKQSTWEKIWWENPMTKRFMNGFGNVEDSARLGLWLNLRKNSRYTDAEIVDTIISTHFDYSTKTVAEIYGQIVIPFITFPIRNFQWWADHAMDSPLITKALIVSAQEDWTEDHYNWENRYSSDFNLAMMMSGNWQSRNGDYTTLVKLNPSLFDAFSMVPGLVMDPTQRISAPVKNIGRLATGDFDSLEYPAQANIKRAGKLFGDTLPRIAEGDLNFLAATIPSVFNVQKYEPQNYEYEDRSRRSHPDNHGRYYVSFYSRQTGIVSGTKDYRNAQAKSAFYGSGGSYSGSSYGGSGYSKGNGYSSGYGYGNPRYRKWDTSMHLAYGKYGAYLRNAPEGTRLINPITRSHLKRSMYKKMYSKAGNSRLLNRTRIIEDPRGLMFRLQDLKYNVF